MRQSRASHIRSLLIAAGVAAMAAWPEAAAGDDRTSGLSDAVRDRLGVRNHLLLSGLVRELRADGLNADNLLGIPDREARLELRPDLTFDAGRLQLGLKPRLELTAQRWGDGPRRGDSESGAELFVNGWDITLEALPALLMSYTREDLQWGPAYLISPSNPFGVDNGRNQPKQELPGADYARIIWLPHHAWTASLIVNTHSGRRQLPVPFRRTYALKVDHLLSDMYLSVILAKREGGDFRGGAFASWNVNDALILYGEAGLTERDAEILAGGSYTLRGGGTVVAEYLYNGGGDPDGDIVQAVLTALERDPRRTLFRRNYALLQYIHLDVLDRLDVSLRAILNMDDASGLVIALAEYGLNDYTRLFTTATVAGGGSSTELGSILEHQFVAGIEVMF